MILKLTLHKEAQDSIDADAMDSDRTFYCKSVHEVEVALGLLARENNVPITHESKEAIPF